MGSFSARFKISDVNVSIAISTALIKQSERSMDLLFLLLFTFCQITSKDITNVVSQSIQ